MHNQEIRAAAKIAGIKLWKIADALEMTDSTFSRKLRHELPDDEKARIIEIIHELAKAS